eukprot:CAMPEP_0184298046 /NCGR_PEP_ID=MMETSP1049-20130417/8908_1 /TAXON_ID=77928 /ORGANISM="Proteomonas sulcata, Strain CCMP704" /LENGTH=114 /DNA_ID=CAMNT_0026608043 /DNA_START=146 /DNA_END=486 /DNA_ORIENTATION=-
MKPQLSPISGSAADQTLSSSPNETLSPARTEQQSAAASETGSWTGSWTANCIISEHLSPSAAPPLGKLPAGKLKSSQQEQPTSTSIQQVSRQLAHLQTKFAISPSDLSPSDPQT